MNTALEPAPKDGLQGLITEEHLPQAEREFPGVTRFYELCAEKPRTFLNLVLLYART